AARIRSRSPGTAACCCCNASRASSSCTTPAPIPPIGTSAPPTISTETRVIVLHAAFRGEALDVWGECRPGEDPVPERTSPYDAGPDRLAAALKAAGLAPPSTKTVSAWLPTVKGAPVASSPLIAEPPAAGAPALQPWTLTACTLGPAEATSLVA